MGVSGASYNTETSIAYLVVFSQLEFELHSLLQSFESPVALLRF